jgi:DNA-binding transcriptional MerR regulator
MNKHLNRLRNDFQGSAEALLAKAQEVAKALNLDQEAAEGNERLLRHYVSIRVVDKPSREGRDALYGFRHLVQFLAARRLLAEGFPLAKIAMYTAVVPTDALTAYLEKSDRASEAELLVEAFRTAASVQGRSASTNSLTGVATGTGMVDVLYEMREMEHRVHRQLKDFQDHIHSMVDYLIRGVSSQENAQHLDPLELKFFVSKLADFMEETTQRFDRMLQKPLLMIEKQMDQQRHLLEQTQKQREFLEGMLSDTLQKQRHELLAFLNDQAIRLEQSLETQRRFYHEVTARLDGFENEMSLKLSVIEKHAQDLSALSRSIVGKERDDN